MANQRYRRILREVLALPTAPFAEHEVLALLDRFCSGRRHVEMAADGAGNRLVRFRKGRRRAPRPVCLTAHVDHPGFVAERMVGVKRLRAAWRGGVRPEFFKGAGVRFFVAGRWIRGTVRSVRCVEKDGQTRVDTAEIAVGGDVPAGAVGMWDLPDPRFRNGRVYTRACDDLAGVAALLCCLDELGRSDGDADAYMLFTRAEEVGFVGAIAAARSGLIPRQCYVVAVENSSELVNARMGDGPILRVGDKASVFTPAVTAHCRAVADGLAKRDKRFRYQRRLMDGGTCESSAYCEFGYEATGICLALGNYHNMDQGRGRIGPEYIHLDDFERLVAWFSELCRPANTYRGADAGLRRKLRSLEKQYGRLLRETAG